MPQPWDQARVAVLIEMLRQLLEVTDLDEDECEKVYEIMIPKLWQR